MTVLVGFHSVRSAGCRVPPRIVPPGGARKHCSFVSPATAPSRRLPGSASVVHGQRKRRSGCPSCRFPSRGGRRADRSAPAKMETVADPLDAPSHGSSRPGQPTERAFRRVAGPLADEPAASDATSSNLVAEALRRAADVGCAVPLRRAARGKPPGQHLCAEGADVLGAVAAEVLRRDRAASGAAVRHRRRSANGHRRRVSDTTGRDRVRRRSRFGLGMAAHLPPPTERGAMPVRRNLSPVRGGTDEGAPC